MPYFEPICKSRSMESLYSSNALCEEGYYESTNQLNNLQQRLSPTRLKLRQIPEIEEVRINPLISKKGYLNFFEEKSIDWSKKYFVSTCLLLNKSMKIFKKICFITLGHKEAFSIYL